jgi:hypothetical protein
MGMVGDSRRRARRVALFAWGALALTLIAVAVMVVFAALSSGVEVPAEFENATDVPSTTVTGLLFCVLGATGAMIVWRGGGNAVGWILLLTPVAMSVTTAVESLYIYGRYAHPGSLPTAAGLIWAVNWLWVMGFVPLVTFTFLLFPDGRLLSPRWRPAAWLAGGALIALVLGYAFAPGPLEDYPVVENPLGVPGVGGAMFEALKGAGIPLMALAAAASATSLVVRFRGSSGEQRQQLRWVAFAGAAAIVLWLAGAALRPVIGTGGAFAVAFGLMLPPVAIAVAVLKYRLYDLDLVINRTLVYGALTATLAGAYVGSVLVLELILRPITAQSNLAIAASTLAVAAAFGPLRRRIQELVDRRFYRHRYDARLTLERFGSRLRDELDLETLRSELAAVVSQTMEPAHVSVWLRSRPE